MRNTELISQGGGFAGGGDGSQVPRVMQVLGSMIHIGIPLGRQAWCPWGVRALCFCKSQRCEHAGGSTHMPCLSPNASLYQGPRNHSGVHPRSGMPEDTRCSMKEPLPDGHSQ